MKLVAIAATAAAISLVLPAPSSHAQAQQARSSPDQQQSQPSQADIPITPAATLVGRDVMGAHGNNAGRVNSIVLDMQNGAVEYVLIEGRDDFDLKGALAAVPWSGLQPPQPQGNITLKISADQLRQSPRINPDIVYELNTPGWRSRIYGYYGYPYPYYYGRRGAYSWYGAYPEGRYGEAHWPAQDQSINGPDKAAQQGNTAQSATQSRHGGDSNSQSGNSSSRESAQSAAQSQLGALAVGQNGVVSTLMSPSSVSPNGLRSADVYAPNGDIVGHVDQVLIDTQHGNVAYLLMERGGFLGLDPTWFALPIEALAWLPYQADYGYRLTADENVLNNVPPVPINRAHLATHVSRHELAQLYHHFGIEPYWQRPGESGNSQPSSSNKG